MLDPDEKLVFDGLVTRLGAADPDFVRRTDRIGRPRLRRRMTAAVLLWTAVPFCIVLGGWTGLLIAVVGAGYGACLFAKRHAGAGQAPWWSSSHRRPGAASR